MTRNRTNLPWFLPVSVISFIGPLTHPLCLWSFQQEHQWTHSGRKHRHHFLNSEQETRSLISSEAEDPDERHVTTFLCLLPAESLVGKIGPITQHVQVCSAPDWVLPSHICWKICVVVNNSTTEYHSLLVKHICTFAHFPCQQKPEVARIENKVYRFHCSRRWILFI